MRKKVDTLVVGAGAGGLAMSLFLARTGRKILLIEKSTQVGGALASFHRAGFDFDAGFHFTGALHSNGIFDQILRMLNLRDKIKPIFMNPNAANIFNFTDSDKIIEFPFGIDNIKSKLKEYFPTESIAIDKYFQTVESICSNTPTMSVETMHITPMPLKEDYITLKEFLDRLTDNKTLKEVLSAFVMCHGTPPSEISMADNARLSFGFYESICTIDGGGSSLVNAFLEELQKFDVEILTSDEIVKICDIKDKKARQFLLKSGYEVNANECVFTISPKAVSDILPESYFPPAFFNRMESFDYTPGFFTIFAELDSSIVPKNVDSIVSLYPETDIDSLSRPSRGNKPGALAILHSKLDEKNILTAFEPIYWELLKHWDNSALGKRPKEYNDWKDKKTAQMLERIYEYYSDYRGNINVVTAATPLTYRDYLNHTQGAAYGIRQKIDQYNLIGQLRLKNIFCAGQSAILPGVLGTIMASLLVARNIIGIEQFKKYLRPPQ